MQQIIPRANIDLRVRPVEPEYPLIGEPPMEDGNPLMGFWWAFLGSMPFWIWLAYEVFW